MKAVFGVQVLAEGQHHDGEGVLIVGQHADALRALVGQRADVDVGAQVVAPHQFQGDVSQLARGERDGDVQDAAVAHPALVVLQRAQHKQLLLGLIPVRADAFKYAGAVVQRVGEDADARLGHRDVLAVEVDNQVGIRFQLHVSHLSKGLSRANAEKAVAASPRQNAGSHFAAGIPISSMEGSRARRGFPLSPPYGRPSMEGCAVTAVTPNPGAGMWFGKQRFPAAGNSRQR